MLVNFAYPVIPTYQHLPQLHASQWQQRIVHTQLFKLFEYGEGHHRQVELWVDEVDSMGHSRFRNLEQFFYGIVGHVKDKRGMSIHGWRQASRIANYWRRHFDVPEEQIEPHQTETTHKSHQDQETAAADDTSTEAQPPQQTPAHIQITQLACILHDILAGDPAFNAPILESLQDPAAGSSSTDPGAQALLTRQGLAQFSGHLAIPSNMMAQSAAAATEIPADDDDHSM